MKKIAIMLTVKSRHLEINSHKTYIEEKTWHCINANFPYGKLKNHCHPVKILIGYFNRPQVDCKVDYEEKINHNKQVEYLRIEYCSDNQRL